MNKEKKVDKKKDLVAQWEINLPDKRHRVTFEHGTITGKRIICLDGKEVLRKDYMFDLVGSESFMLNNHMIKITISVTTFSYEYSLFVDGKALDKFQKGKDLVTKAWEFNFAGSFHRVVIDKTSLDIWLNGNLVETNGEFSDDGTKTCFQIEDKEAYVLIINSGNKKTGFQFKLFVDKNEVS